MLCNLNNIKTMETQTYNAVVMNYLNEDCWYSIVNVKTVSNYELLLFYSKKNKK